MRNAKLLFNAILIALGMVSSAFGQSSKLIPVALNASNSAFVQPAGLVAAPGGKSFLHSRFGPLSKVIINRLPGWEIMRHPAPRTTLLVHIKNRVHNFPLGNPGQVAPRRVRRHQG